MKSGYLILLPLLFFLGCQSAPKNFTYRYTGEPTRLGDKINIDGYYVMEHGCDSNFYSMVIFYPDGLFLIATTSVVSHDLIACFNGDGVSTISDYPNWGIYKIEGNVIKTQSYRSEGNGFTIFRDYEILPNRSLVNTRDFVEPRYSNLGYLKNYPSFTDNSCRKPAKFYPLLSKRDKTSSPLLKKSWIYPK